MPMVIPSGYAYLVAKFSVTGGTELKTITMGVNWDDVAHPSVSELCEAYGDTIVAEIIPSLTTTYTFESVKGIGNDSGTLWEGEHTFATPGTDAGDVESPQVAVKVQKKTGLMGRAYRGLNYWPGLAEAVNVNANGSLTTAARSTLQTVFDDWRAALITANIAPVILHGDELDPLPVPTLVTSFQVMAYTGTQKRRVN